VTGYKERGVEILSFATRGRPVDDVILKENLHFFCMPNIFPAKNH
jgi:hypothetical protein